MPSQKLKILFVCSRNNWRSPTAVQIYRKDPRAEVRSAGTSPSANHQISHKDVSWADEILVMEPKHRDLIRQKFSTQSLPPITILDIPDDYTSMDPELIELLKAGVETFLASK